MNSNHFDSRKFGTIKNKMQKENLPQLVINNFKHYYTRLAEMGQSGGLISEDSIEPVGQLPSTKNLDEKYSKLGKKYLSSTVMIKLNGGLGTSMGLNKAKSLLKVKDGYSFLDIIIHQAIRDDIPLVLMNSFNTRQDSIDVMKQYSELKNDLPFDFVQHKVPKILQKDLSPAHHPEDKQHEWCPPGHGDIYNALVTSGMLEKLLKKGYKYAFVSNSDNLGGVIDKPLLGYFADQGLPFMMEVARRQPADKKGGHLARQQNDGQLILREIAQCPEKELQDFQNIKKYKYFNTNNLWFNLEALKKKMDSTEKGMILPMICNEKHLDPRDPSTAEVFQLETAMGSAIAAFKGSQAIEVSKKRFMPVKKTNSLLNIRSDNYLLTEDFEIIRNPERELNECDIDLDTDYYKLIDEMEARFPAGPPSMLNCKSLKVRGDIKFGPDLKLIGDVSIFNTDDKQKTIQERVISNKLEI
ncbi:MAG TPA: UTP--glucose-1-phosphate uridylyltransferase [bacterium]|nr:UTP--glucose-1-phosphate uridylyltransferase [bacterium]